MMRLFLLLLVAAPLIELYLLIEVGARIGGIETILLCLATAAGGGYLVRHQGLRTLFAARREMELGRVPAEHAAHGALLAFAGLMLLTPGFVTDGVGLLLLVPALRRRLVRRLLPPQDEGDWIEAEIVEERDRDGRVTWRRHISRH